MRARKKESKNLNEVMYRINKDILTDAEKKQPDNPCTLSIAT
jgi:hypothetical protein